MARVAVVSADAGLSVAMSRLLPDHELHPFGNATHVVDSSVDYDAAVVALGTTAAGLETVGRLPVPARCCLVIGDDVPAGSSDGPRVVRAPVRMDAMVEIVRELTGSPTDTPESARPAAIRPKVDLLHPPVPAGNGHAPVSDEYERALVFETEIGPPEPSDVEVVPEREPEPLPASEPMPEPPPQPEPEPEPPPEVDQSGFDFAGEDAVEPTAVAVRFWLRAGAGEENGTRGIPFEPDEAVLDEALRILGGDVASLWLRSSDDTFDVTAVRGLGALEGRAWLPTSHPLLQLLEEAEAVRLHPAEDTGGLLSGVGGHGGDRCVALALRDEGRLAAVVVVGGASAPDDDVERFVLGTPA